MKGKIKKLKDKIKEIKEIGDKAIEFFRDDLGIETMLFVTLLLAILLSLSSCVIPVPIPIVMEGPPPIENYERMIYGIHADQAALAIE